MTTKQAPPKLTEQEMEALYARAAAAGEKAFREAIPTPMIVGEAIGLGSEIDYSKPTYYVSEGICGAPGVRVVPGTSRFARWLKKTGRSLGTAYRGGTSMKVWEMCGDRGSQSYARWDAASQAIVATLREAGITAYNESWVD